MGIIITSALVSPGIEEIQELKNEISRSTVYLFQENGDENIYFVDRLLNLNESEGLIDDRHPNSLGFAIISIGYLIILTQKIFLNCHK